MLADWTQSASSTLIDLIFVRSSLLRMNDAIVKDQVLILRHRLCVDVKPDRTLHRIAVCVLERRRLVEPNASGDHLDDIRGWGGRSFLRASAAEIQCESLSGPRKHRR